MKSVIATHSASAGEQIDFSVSLEGGFRNDDFVWATGADDAGMLTDWAAGNRDDCFVHVAKDDEGKVLGVAMVALKPELLSHAPSAHGLRTRRLRW
jgi:hypothetical protein